jgi:hypothetical protein
MTIYCEGAAKAEIIFSLTGGREAKIISYNPPVEIAFGRGQIFNFYDNRGLLPSLIFSNFVSDLNNFFSSAIYSHSIEDSLGAYEYPWLRNFGVEPDVFNPKVIFFNNDFSDFDNNRSNFKIKKIFKSFPHSRYVPDNLWTSMEHYPFEAISFSKFLINERERLIIQDQSGLLFNQQMPTTPTWEVKCISCPPGDCAVSGANGESVCMDCKKIKKNLVEINRKLAKYGKQ